MQNTISEECFFQPELFINEDYEKKTFSIEDISISLYALYSSASTDFDLTGQILWPASKILAKYLIENKDLIKEKRVIELGAGAGLAGLVAAKISENPSNITLSDNNELVLNLLQKNINLNFPEHSHLKKPHLVELSWGEDETADTLSNRIGGAFDLIIAADVIFWHSAVPLLFKTVDLLFKLKSDLLFCLCYTERSLDISDLILKYLKEFKMNYKMIDFTDTTQSLKTFIFLISKL